LVVLAEVVPSQEYRVSEKKSEKIAADWLTFVTNTVFFLSRWKRDSSNQGVRSMYIWDCKLDSILSRQR